MSGAVSTSAGLAIASVPRDLSGLSLSLTLRPQACLTAPGTMSEARRDSTSSLQRKKPPWLKLDIPAAVPPAAEEPSFLQVSSGQEEVWSFGNSLARLLTRIPLCSPCGDRLSCGV